MVITELVASPILLSDIVPDPLQPRKYFDPVEHQELTLSVQLYDIMQPITVRPTEDGKYKIVFGERRYKACLAVMSLFPERNSIPAFIKDMNDEEALLRQIVENLQRKNVHPLEEADSFKRLHQRETIAEIAYRTGKAQKYIAQRLTLCELTPEWQALLLANRVKLGIAFKIARCPVKFQQQIYQNSPIPDDWADRPDWELPSSVKVTQHSSDLSNATFDLGDATLCPEVGACNHCQYNSMANQLLFPDMQTKPICNNPVCFAMKSGLVYQQQLKKAMDDPDTLLVSTSTYYHGDKEKIAIAEDLGATVLAPGTYQLIEPPQSPPSWEEYWQNEIEYVDMEDCEPEELQEMETNSRAEYDNLVEDYQVEFEEYLQSPVRKVARKAFVVTGQDEGAFVEVILTEKTSVMNEQPGQDRAIKDIDEQVAKIHARNERNKELDREKIYKGLIDLFKSGDDIFHLNEKKLSFEECATLLYTLCSECSAVNNLVSKKLDLKQDYYGVKLFNAIVEKQTPELLHLALRKYITNKLINSQELDYGKKGKPAAIYTLGKQYFLHQLTAIEDLQNIRAKKRMVNANKRLDDLTRKKAGLQKMPNLPEEPTLEEAVSFEEEELAEMD